VNEHNLSSVDLLPHTPLIARKYTIMGMGIAVALYLRVQRTRV
jgi:hypothetical protein